MEKFKTILEKNTTAEIIEKKSRFIANLFYVETPQEAENKIKQIKKKYYDAKHNCFAYITLNENEIQKKCSDDGEPSGTAGAPMLEILEKQSIYNVVVIVTRYFGGILLGTGGLVRAYSDSLKEVIKKSTLVEQEPGYEAEIKLPYADFEKFKYYCNKNNINIINSEYSDFIICKIEVNDAEKNRLEIEFREQNNFKIMTFDIIRQKNISKMSNKLD
ncbi:yigZ family protein [Clostridium sp. CAG:492]|nr:yigZ family protein [Clostridium sp. CAG:492]